LGRETIMLTTEQLETVKKLLERSETLHHKIMAKMGDERFDLLDAWEQKERIDLEIGKVIRSTRPKPS
jgi:hypothetical protein